MADAGRYDITIYQGATFVLDLTWTDDAGAAIPLTGYTAELQLRTDYRDETAALTLTDADGIALGGAAGTIRVTIDRGRTSALEARAYSYDLLLVNAGVGTRLIEGRATVSPAIAR